jgi:N-methylhydantoinase A/oxoprolinase/acetone carboxylase beta subunit
MRYAGQGHEVEAPLPDGPLGPEALGAITAAFEAAYRALYHRTPMGVTIETLNWRVVVAGPVPALSLAPVEAATGGGAGAESALKGTRPAWFPEARDFVPTPVYDRYRLRPGMRLSGPAIIEERESTTVVGPGARVAVDAHLTLVAEPEAAPGPPRPAGRGAGAGRTRRRGSR